MNIFVAKRPLRRVVQVQLIALHRGEKQVNIHKAYDCLYYQGTFT